MQFSKLPTVLLVVASRIATADIMQTYYWAGASSPPAGRDAPFTIDWQYNDGNWHRGVNAGYDYCNFGTGVYTQEYLCLHTASWTATFKFQNEGERCMRLSSCGGTTCGACSCSGFGLHIAVMCSPWLWKLFLTLLLS
ncbi:hypothetical protein VTL71DRAFT_1391 [Oculimacula yallundae]|uniref:Uncharacterized protein n=1 Tax=Oculimacula yallundae TaxID=86028 RepID=A0ABR4CAJ1_9HELO